MSFSMQKTRKELTGIAKISDGKKVSSDYSKPVYEEIEDTTFKEATNYSDML